VEMARSSAAWRAASMDAHVDVSLATAPATTTRARQAASPVGSTLCGVGAPRGRASDLKTRGSTANRTGITSEAREDHGIKKESLP
jgi:hypothetical protein